MCLIGCHIRVIDVWLVIFQKPVANKVVVRHVQMQQIYIHMYICMYVNLLTHVKVPIRKFGLRPYDVFFFFFVRGISRHT